MPLTNPTGVDNTTHLTYGEWSHVRMISDPLGAATVTYAGAVREGVVRVSRTEIELMDTTFPALPAHSIPSSVSMEFAGQALELTAELMHGLVGDAGVDDSTPYINPGSACPSESTDFTLEAQRENCDGRMIVVRTTARAASPAWRSKARRSTSRAPSR